MKLKVAVIDVGFNSIKMLRYKVESDGFLKSYGQLGMLAKLGEGLEGTGYLGHEQISRTVDTLRLCRETASLDSIKHILLVGTSPVREAANWEEFLRRVEEETGLRMRVLTGNEEALYGVLGALTSMDAPSVLFFDLGGGSLELTYVNRARIRRILSLPLGALKLTSAFAGKDGTFSKKNRGRLAKQIAQVLPSTNELGLDGDTILVGTGGTVRAMARYEQDRVDYPFDKVHNYSMEFDSVQQMSRKFLKLKLSELDRMEAIGQGRSETMAAGALVVRTLMEKLDFKRLTVSTHGLRDGILMEFLQGGKRNPNVVAQKEDIERLLARQAQPPGSADYSDLIECMEKNNLIDGREKKILLMAAWRMLSPECTDANSYEVFGILMSEDLPMTHEDQLLMALSVVRARRPRPANWLAKKYGAFLSHDERRVKKLGACLRLVELLDRSKVQYRVAYSGGLRITIVNSEGPYPQELASMATLALSSVVKRPVTISVSSKGRERQAGLVKVGN